MGFEVWLLGLFEVVDFVFGVVVFLIVLWLWVVWVWILGWFGRLCLLVCFCV